MNNNSTYFRQFLLNQSVSEQHVQRQKQNQQPAIKLKNQRRKTNIDLGPMEIIQKKVRKENPNILEKIQMNPIDLVKQSPDYSFGNYKKYQEIRDNKKWNDPRMSVLDSLYFENRNVLDIGCNDGTITLLIALKYFPKLIRGIDIDYTLINKAVENLTELEKQQKKIKENEFQPIQLNIEQIVKDLEDMPICFASKLKQDIQEKIELNSLQTELTEKNQNGFPQNVYFRVENYIGNQKNNEQYDTILCLSITKWIHLNFGDAGIQRLFRKVNNQLTLNGYFILEPQDWKSYKKKKYLSKEFKQNYSQIELRPSDFPAALIKQYGMKLIKIIKPDDNEAINKSRSTFKRTIFIFQKIQSYK